MAKWEQDTIIQKANKWDKDPIVERGLAGEAGAAVVRTFLNEAKGLTGTLGTVLTRAAPLPALVEMTRPGTISQPIGQAVANIRSAEQKFQPTRQDKTGWVVNTLAGGGTQLGINLVAGQKLGWIGPAVNMFSVARQNTLDAGGSELEADLTGLSESALEVWGVSRLLKFKEAGKGSFKALINSVRKGLIKQAAGNLKNIGTNALKSALVEGLEEVSQGGAEFLWETIPGGRDIPRKADGSVDWWNIVGSLAEQGAGGALVGGVIPLGMGGVETGVETAVEGRKRPQAPVSEQIRTPEKPVEARTQVDEGKTTPKAEIVTQEQQEPLGLYRKPVIDTTLKNMSDDDFDKYLEKVSDKLDALEKQWDEDLSLESDNVFRKKLAKVQDEYTAAQNEEWHRKMLDWPVEDIVDEFKTLRLDNADDKVKAYLIVDAVKQRGIEKDFQNEINKIAGKSSDWKYLIDTQLENLKDLAQQFEKVESVKQPKQLIEQPVEQPTQEQQGQEKLTGAAIRLKSGEILTGTTHANILRDVQKSGRTISNEEFDIPAGTGFVTNKGNFVSPQEGWDIAEKAGQLKLEGKDAMAQEFIDRKHLIAEGVEFAKPEQPKPKPLRMGRRKLLKLGHDIPKALGWDDAQRRDFMQQTVGKSTMKAMKPKEMKVLVQALQEKARDSGLLPPEGYEKTLFIGPKEVETKKFFDDIVQITQNLKGKKQLRKEKVITRKGEKKQFSLIRAAKELLVGIDNDSIPHLLNRIGGTKEGSIKDVITNYRRSIHNISSIYRGSVDMLNEALDKASITPKDLAEWSIKLDPRFELIKRGRELIGKSKTKQYTVTLNGKQYKLSMAELLDIYLSAQQEVGLNHITNAGLKIFGKKTGAIPVEQLQPILDIVRANPKAMAFADAVVDIATNYIAPQLNYTNGRLNPGTLEKLADEKNYWHLRTDKPLLIKGKETYGISFLENKNILKPRTKGTKGALVVSDALSKFLSVQYAAAEYIGMAEEMRLLNMMLNYQPVIDNLESKGYGDIRNNLKTLIEWAQGSKGNYTRTDAVLAKVLHGSYRAVLHFSPEVIMAQYMSTGHYAGVVDAKYVPLLSVPPTPKLVHEMLEHNPVVWMRYYAGGQSAELAETGELDTTLRLLSGKRADLNKTGIASQITDLSAFAQGWKLAKAIVTDTTNLKEGSPEFFDAVNDKAEELWDTQPSWDKWNKSVNTSQRGIKKLPFLFRSYFEKSLMMLHTANAEYNASNKSANDKAKWAQTYGAVLGSQMATALMRLAMAHFVWRKRKTVWDLIAAIVAAPLPMVGIVGGFLNRVASNFFRIIGGKKQEYEGEPISNLAVTTTEKLFKGIGQMVKAASYYINGNEEMAKKEMEYAGRNMIISIGTIKGVPVRQIEKTVEAIEGEKTGTRKGGGGYAI